MPIFLRALSVANAVREWFAFTNEAVSFLGFTKRAVAAGVIAAAVAAPVIVAKPAPTLEQLKDAREAIQPAQGSVSVQNIIDECRDKPCNAYSTIYLTQPGRRPLAEQIVETCESSTKLSEEQCQAADRAIKQLDAHEREARMNAARRKAELEAPEVGRLKMPWEH